MKTSIIGLVFFYALTSIGYGQSAPMDSLKKVLSTMKDDTSKVKLLLKIGIQYRSTDPQSAVPYTQQAVNLSTQLGYDEGLALGYKFTGLALYDQGKFIDAMDNYNHSLQVFERMTNKVGVSNIQNNIGVIYKEQGLDEKALEAFFASLQNAEDAGDILRIITAQNNIGSVYDHKDANRDKALVYYKKALPGSRQLGDHDLIGATLGNIGETYLKKTNSNPDTIKIYRDSALFYFQLQKKEYAASADIPYALYNIGRAYISQGKFENALSPLMQAYDSAVTQNSTLYITQALEGLANAYDSLGKYNKSLEARKKAEKLAREINSLYDLKDIYNGLAFDYGKLSDFGNAYRYQSLLVDIKDKIYTRDADIKLAQAEFEFDTQQQNSLIELQKASIARQKLARNASIVGFALVLLIVVILYRDYRNKLKINRILDTQKAQIETLLSNILPREVSRELQATGEATPRFYESVSVLFTDFKGFTTIADSLSPQEVVAELSEIFTTFDNIIEKYGLEKIKTIGDAYMVAGGIPSETHDHPVKMVKAAIEIVHYMRHNNLQRKMKGHQTWELRVGIHTGPLVAGVVGRKKYAYDIWGSTVNVASRMESNGEPGQINISSATYELVKDQFDCEYRGKIYAKNVGDIDMYFVKETFAKPAGMIAEDIVSTPN
ncbi:MAG: adenylate/guanylate cyclase domain-containing protein [Chitinophagaceae bacterium]